MENREPTPVSDDVMGVDDVQQLVDEGRDHYRRGEFDAALRCFESAHAAAQAAGKDAQAAEAANDLGVVCIVLQRWESAEEWLNKAQRIFTALQDLDGEAQTLGNIGSMYRARGNLRDAAVYFQLAADRFRLVGGDTRRSSTLRSLGMVRLRQFRPFLALVAFEAACACQPNPNLIQRALRNLLALPLRLLQR